MFPLRDILTTGQAARELGVTPLTVSRWCQAAHAGQPSPIQREECFRPGRDWKIRSTAVTRLLGAAMVTSGNSLS